MWIFTNGGMVSIVEHTDDPDVLLVRARTKAHLEAFTSGAMCRLRRTPDADYAWRTVLPREVVQKLIKYAVQELDYPDFKSSLPKGLYKQACGEVWADMLALQQEYEVG